MQKPTFVREACLTQKEGATEERSKVSPTLMQEKTHLSIEALSDVHKVCRSLPDSGHVYFPILENSMERHEVSRNNGIRVVGEWAWTWFAIATACPSREPTGE